MEDKAKEEWLNVQKPSTKATYKSLWWYFQEFTGLTGDQIIESRKKDKEYYWEKKVIEFKDWMSHKKSEKSAATAASAIRGFFAYHRLPLEFRRPEKARLTEAKPKYEDYRYSREDLIKICQYADLDEKYVVIVGKSFGLRAGDFLRLTRGHLEPYINREAPISIGEYATTKKSVPAYPFIDVDSKPIIELMLEKMDRERRTKPTERILTYKKSIQLSRVLKRLTRKAGIKIGSKRVRFHCLRKFLIDRLASFMSESKWKQIVGKKISEGAYVSPDLLRDDYSRAMNETCFSKRMGAQDLQLMAKKEALLAIAKSMGFTEPQLRTMRITRKARSVEDEIALYEEAIEKRRQEQTNATDCPNGEHCSERFEEIDEVNLLQYLKRGWQIVHTNSQNGKVIIRKG